MARVPDVELERLKRDVSLQRLCEAKGMALARHGADGLIGHCPFHDDKTPSFVVSPKKNVWHCLGACRAGGSVIDFVMKVEGLSFRHAVELLRNDVALTASTTKPGAAKQSSVRRLAPPVSNSTDDTTVLADVRDYYHQTLNASPEALAYLESRGLRDDALISHFKLGFANRTLGLRLPESSRLAGAELRTRLQKLGVYRESGHEHLNGSLVVPLHAETGKVVGMYGRKVTPNLRPGTPLHLYLPGPHRAAFNSVSLVSAGGTAILCEAVLDALSFWAAGYRNVIAAYGVDGFTAVHLDALVRHQVRRVFIAYDRDDAGDAAALALGKQLEADGLDCYRVQFPRGLDANAYACKVTPAAKSLGVALRHAAFMGAGVPRGTPDFSSLVAAGAPAEASTSAVPPALEGMAPALAARVATAPVVSVAVPEHGAADAAPPVPSTGVSVSPSSENPNVTPKAISTNTSPSNSPLIERGAAANTSVMASPSTTVASTNTAPSSSPLIERGAPVAGSVMVTSAQAGSIATSSPPTSSNAPMSTASNAATPNSSSTTSTSSSSADETTFTFGPRRYRLRGLSRPHTPDSLRLNVLLAAGDAFHVDTFDLYSAKARAAFIHSAAGECRVETEVVKRDVGQLLLNVEALLDKRREDAKGPKTPVLSDEERDDALALLRTPHLLQRVLDDFARCGVVGEETNKLVGYLAAVSRKLEEPLAVLIQSSSAAGKSSLMEAVLAFVPDEEKTKYSAMTGQSLFYMGDVSLRHKVLAVVEEEGASRASYALKLLQSEGELTIASTGKDPHTGRLVTHEYRVEGPTQLFLTTTAAELDEELLNRCLVLSVDEDTAQTKAIHHQQREKQTLDGLLARRSKEATLKLHQNAQRLLRPLAVVNAFAPRLTFLADRTRARRDFPKYLTLIRAVTLLHQYQRPTKTAQHAGGSVEYLEVTPEDIALANRLAAHIFGRILDDLPPQTRRVLGQLEAYVSARAKLEACPRSAVVFTRRQVREAVGGRNSQLALHLSRLADFEYVRLRRTAHGAFAYSLAQDDDVPAPRAAGLADADSLGASTTAQLPGVAASFRGPSGVLPGLETGSCASPTPRAHSGFLSQLSASGVSAHAHSPLAQNGVVPGNVVAASVSGDVLP